eukprot:2829314-Amphidinium_carterae.1
MQRSEIIQQYLSQENTNGNAIANEQGSTVGSVECGCTIRPLMYTPQLMLGELTSLMRVLKPRSVLGMVFMKIQAVAYDKPGNYWVPQHRTKFVELTT